LVGTSTAIRSLQQQITTAARERCPLWIHGEDGVDRDLVAREVHGTSPWANGSFDTIDLSGLPPELVRREVYGAEPGVFSELPEAHRGALERADRGTLLLEGVEATPKEVQEDLSAALGSGRFTKLGARAEQPIECRVIATGSKPVRDLVRSGRLVRGLGERLAALEIEVPPLRSHTEDIPLIAARVLAEARDALEAETGRPCRIRGFSPSALERLASYPWPGNERELREQIRAAVSIALGEQIEPEDLMLGWSSADQIPSFRDAKRAFEREYVTRLLRICRGNISRAARIARKDRKDFYDVMRRNEINPTEFRR
jgi:two-component system response regulator GlrR